MGLLYLITRFALSMAFLLVEAPIGLVFHCFFKLSSLSALFFREYNEHTHLTHTRVSTSHARNYALATYALLQLKLEELGERPT